MHCPPQRRQGDVERPADGVDETVVDCEEGRAETRWDELGECGDSASGPRVGDRGPDGCGGEDGRGLEEEDQCHHRGAEYLVPNTKDIVAVVLE